MSLEPRVAVQVGIAAGFISACVPLAGVAVWGGTMNAKIERVQEDRAETLKAIRDVSIRVDQIYALLGGRLPHTVK